MKPSSSLRLRQATSTQQQQNHHHHSEITSAGTTDPPSVLPSIEPSSSSPPSNEPTNRIGPSIGHKFSRRGPRKWTDYLGFYLPSYDGPNDVGTLTLELPIPEPFSNYKLSSPMRRANSKDEPVLELNNSLMTIFYPAQKLNRTTINDGYLRYKLSTLKKSLTSIITWRDHEDRRLRWITFSQIKGYLRFASIRSWKRWLIIPALLLTLGSTKLPTRGGPTILPPKKSIPRANHQDTQSPTLDDQDDHDRPRYKLIIFSHGLTGNRTCYSQLCGKLASQGYVVAAIEHRDGTSSHSQANYKQGNKIVGKEVPYIDMIDVSPETRPDNYLYARAHQLELRTIELLACSKLLSKFSESDKLPVERQEGPSISKSKGWRSIRDSNLRIKGSLGWSGDDGLDWSDQQWADFANSVDWNRNVIVSGHSFGAANVITAARHQDRPEGWERFILYDPWIETLDYITPKFLSELRPKMGGEDNKHDPMKSNLDSFPCLIINSPGFTDWRDHFKRLQDIFIIDLRHRPHDLCLITTLGGIIHSSFSDLPILVEWVWKVWKKLKLDSQKAINLIVNLSMEFIQFPIISTDSDHNKKEDERHEGNEDCREDSKIENWLSYTKIRTSSQEAKNRLESFIHLNNLRLEEEQEGEEGNVKQREEGRSKSIESKLGLSKHPQHYLDFIKPGKFFVHFKRFV